MGWMDFLGGAAAGGIRGLGELEDRRRREQDLAENRKRYEDLLQEKALSRAFEEKEAERRAAESDAQLILQGQSRDLQERGVALQEDAAKRARFQEGVELGQMGLQQSFLRDPAKAKYSPENYQAALAAGIRDPRVLYYPQLQEQADARDASLRRSLAQYGSGRRPMTAGEAFARAREMAADLFAPRYRTLSTRGSEVARAQLAREEAQTARALGIALSDPNASFEDIWKLAYPEPAAGAGGSVEDLLNPLIGKPWRGPSITGRPARTADIPLLPR